MVTTASPTPAVFLATKTTAISPAPPLCSSSAQCSTDQLNEKQSEDVDEFYRKLMQYLEQFGSENVRQRIRNPMQGSTILLLKGIY